MNTKHTMQTSGQSTTHKSVSSAPVPSPRTVHEIQIHKEARITVLVYALFFLWWYSFGYGLDPSIKLFGIPAWFFMSCIVGSVVFNFLFYLVVKKCFMDIPFEEYE